MLPPGGRTVGEHKIQLILPGHTSGSRANFDESGGRYVILCGLESELGVFVLWDAGLYRDIAYSRNVQVSAESIYDAFSGRVVEQTRRLRGVGSEVLVAAPASRLHEALVRRVDLTLERLLETD